MPDEQTTSNPVQGTSAETDAQIARLADAIRGLRDVESAHDETVSVWSDDPPHLGAPRVGHYQLTREIDAGGMGFVYEAIQDQPRRAVAVKLMRHGLSSKAAIRRFEYEAQILARLHHPGIAQIFEAGTHQHGELAIPYFAMELIPGARPITAYASDKKLTLRQRLELFIGVCDAAHHAHQKGILHRDLKPQNILIDLNGRVKVIDFGIARAVDADQVPATLQTSPDQLLGTLQYMSPEQLEGDPRELDARADVYALGVVLYELVCGRVPYEVSASKLSDASKVIHEQPPLPPRSANAAIDSDLETVVLMALHKERARRYQSAKELADDLRHVLADEPITARRDSVPHVLRTKLLSASRRHRVTGGILAAALGLLLAQIVGNAAESRWQVHSRYAAWATSRLTRYPGPTLECVRVVVFHDTTDYDRIARTIKVPRTEQNGARWLRAARGALLSQLAESGARAVVLDYFYPNPSPERLYDEKLLHGADALAAHEIPLIVGINGLPDGPPPIMPGLATRARWGHLLVGTTEGHPWTVPLAVEHPNGTPPIPSLALSAYAAVQGVTTSKPMMAAMPRLSIDAIAKHVILHSSSGVVFDQVGFTKFDVAKEEAPGGEARRPPDAQASLVVSMPPDNVFSRSTLDGAAVLDMSGDELQRFAGGKVIVVCNDHDTTKHDVHHYPDGRHFSGGQVHAAALDALLSGRIISTPPWWYFLGLTIDSRIVWECLLAAVGAILGAYVARLPRHRLGNGIVMVSLSAIVIGACILSYHLAGVLYSPLVPALAATIAFELAYVTWRSTTRNVV